MKAINDCYELNKRIKEMGLVELTWGNASVLEDDFVYIKASGVDVKQKFPTECYCQVSLNTGENFSDLKPSVDLDTHLELYRGFSDTQAIIHTHSKYATAFAQAGMPLPCVGTTHADYFKGSIPVVSFLDDLSDYERDTGKSIVKHFHTNNISHHDVNACLVQGHGVFVWADSPEKCLESAFVLELLAEMAYYSLTLNPNITFPNHILEKHYDRKHGESKYYGQ